MEGADESIEFELILTHAIRIKYCSIMLNEFSAAQPIAEAQGAPC